MSYRDLKNRLDRLEARQEIKHIGGLFLSPSRMGPLLTGHDEIELVEAIKKFPAASVLIWEDFSHDDPDTVSLHPLFCIENIKNLCKGVQK